MHGLAAQALALPLFSFIGVIETVHISLLLIPALVDDIAERAKRPQPCIFRSRHL
jgi:hypothetical protein